MKELKAALEEYPTYWVCAYAGRLRLRVERETLLSEMEYHGEELLIGVEIDHDCNDIVIYEKM